MGLDWELLYRHKLVETLPTINRFCANINCQDSYSKDKCDQYNCGAVMPRCPACNESFVATKGLVCKKCKNIPCDGCGKPTTFVQMGTRFRLLCKTCLDEQGTDMHSVCYKCSELTHVLDLNDEQVCRSCEEFEDLVSQGICVQCKNPFGNKEYNHEGKCEECMKNI